MNADETTRFLIGSWRVRRVISDYRSGEEGFFEGTATFTPLDANAEVLRFEETGTMHFGAYRGSARRQLDYAVTSESTLRVSFLDGRDFIDLDLTAGTSMGLHLCNVDRYEITTIVTSADVLEEHWRVEGPLKSYAAVTTLERSRDAARQREAK
jgi:hypothetical protein